MPAFWKRGVVPASGVSFNCTGLLTLTPEDGVAAVAGAAVGGVAAVRGAGKGKGIREGSAGAPPGCASAARPGCSLRQAEANARLISHRGIPRGMPRPDSGRFNFITSSLLLF